MILKRCCLETKVAQCCYLNSSPYNTCCEKDAEIVGHENIRLTRRCACTFLCIRIEVVQASDYSGSTSAMVRYVKEAKAERYLLLTECSMGDNIAAENRNKEMLRLCSIRCPHMNEITLEMTLEALKKTQYKIEVPEDIRVRAKTAVDRMIAIG